MTLEDWKRAGCKLDKTNQLCCRCNKRPTLILYSVDLRFVRAKHDPAGATPTGIDGYKPWCEQCCEHLALGMMRDVAEIQFGKERATVWYQGLQKLKAIHNEAVRKAISASLHETIQDYENHHMNLLLENRLRGEELDALEAKQKAEAAKRQSAYGPMFERIVSTAMLHEALALATGVTLQELSERIDLKAITLEGGPGVQLVTVIRRGKSKL